MRDLVKVCPEGTRVVTSGSGYGEQENRLMKSIPHLEVICVDPAPMLYPVNRLDYADGKTEVVLQPKYDTVG
jgi:hypothetical protein